MQNIDEAITILTGVEAGQRDEEGKFPADSINGKVEEQLITYAMLRKKHAEKDDEEEDEEE